MPLARKPTNRQFDSLTKKDLNAVLSHYNLGELLAAHSLVIEGDYIVLLQEKSETSRKYLIDTTGGRYFFKEVPWYCDEPRYRDFSSWFMASLWSANLPVPRIIRASDDSWSASVGGNTFVIMQYLPGSQYRPTDHSDSAAASTLARIHLVAETLPLPTDAPKETLHAIVDAHFVLANDVRTPVGADSDSLDGLRSYARSVLTSSGDDHVIIPVHGDYNPWNLAFAPTGAVSAIYDFDNACLDRPLHDLGEALASFFLVARQGRSSMLRPLTHRIANLPVQRMANFVRAYTQIRPLNRQDLSDLLIYTLGAWWESVLLSYIRGDQTEQCFDAMNYFHEILNRNWPAIIAASRA